MHELANSFRINCFIFFNTLTFMNISQYLAKLEAVNRFLAFTVKFKYIYDLLHRDNTSKLPVLYEFYECLQF